MRCSCLVPFYNEGSRIGRVLVEILKSKEVDEIVCVDDGSSDGGSSMVRGRFPGVKLVVLKRNKGKTGAVREGLKKIGNELVVLIDADLRKFKVAEMDAAIKRMKRGDVDMVVLRRVEYGIFVKLIRGDVLITGERVMRADDLREALGDEGLKCYQMEPVINQYMIDKGKRIVWMPHGAVSTNTISKVGMLRGVKKEWEMLGEIKDSVGVKNFVYQYLFFGWKKG